MRRLASPFARTAVALALDCALLLTFLLAPICRAQTQQPFLFASEASNGQISDFAVFVRNDQTGDLTEAAGSPFTSLHSTACAMSVVDPKGRFLYGSCGLGASMYSMDATTGAITEVSGSPFAGSSDTRRGAVAAESTGQFVYVLKFSLNDPYPTPSSVVFDTFQVDSANLQLVAQTSQTLTLSGSLIAAASSQHGFYLLLNEPQSSSPYPLAVLHGILFDPASGQASVLQLLEQTSLNARALLMDNAAKNLVVSAGQDSGSIWFLQLSPTDGTISGAYSVPLAAQEFASFVTFDPSSTYFYLRFEGTGATETGVRIFDVATQLEASSSPVPANLESELGGEPDPQGPFGYFSGPAPGGGISVYGVDLTTGYPLTPTSFTNPLFPGRSLGPAVATIDLNTQPVQAPAATLSPTALSFGSVSVGQTSSPQTATLTNTGSLALDITSIQLGGAKAADFTESDNCASSPQLLPNRSCTISVTYHPAATGAGSAAVLVTDNASGSPQQISLSGTGGNPGPPPPPAPAVALNPNPFNFAATITEGTTSSPQNLVLTNSGNATLHVQTVTLGGINTGDFAIAASNCIGALAANATCAVSLTFSPLGPGVRSATLSIADDAPNSPQILNITGLGGAAALISASTGVVSVSAGQPAQFNLQATPGAGFNGTLTFACTGAPQGASCNVPASVAITNGASTAFTVTVTTSGSSGVLPMSEAPRSRLIGVRVLVALVFVLLGVFLLSRFGVSPRRRDGWALTAATALLLYVIAGTAGCGGGGASSTPTPAQKAVVATPAGVYTITVTPTATPSAKSQQQFPLTPINLTLTVN